MNLSLRTLGASPSYGTPSSTCKPFLPSPFPRFLFRFTNLVSEVKVKVHQLFLYCSSFFLIIIFLSLFLSSLSHPTSYLFLSFFFHRRTISLLNFFPAMICRTVDNHVASTVSSIFFSLLLLCFGFSLLSNQKSHCLSLTKHIERGLLKPVAYIFAFILVASGSNFRNVFIGVFIHMQICYLLRSDDLKIIK